MLKEKYIGFIYIFGVILTSYSQIHVATLGTHKIKLHQIAFCVRCTLYVYGNTSMFLFLAQLFSKKTSRYCYSPGVVGGVSAASASCKTLTFSNISVITEDI